MALQSNQSINAERCCHAQMLIDSDKFPQILLRTIVKAGTLLGKFKRQKFNWPMTRTGNHLRRRHFASSLYVDSSEKFVRPSLTSINDIVESNVTKRSNTNTAKYAFSADMRAREKSLGNTSLKITSV